MKRKKKSSVVKKRNPTVAHIMFRKAGAHKKSNKAERAKEKNALKKEICDE